MRISLFLLATFVLAAPRNTDAQAAGGGEPNTLSDAEKAAGWKLLFDGKTTKGWRGYEKKDVPPGWVVEDGTLARVANAGDLITTKQYKDFDLALEWKISEGGNSGVMYRVAEGNEEAYQTGPEMQVLDDERHSDGKSRLTAAGSDFGLYPAPAGIVKPAGQWNQIRIVVRGHHVEHWMNGIKVVEYELESPDWEVRVAKSKFKQWPGYGRAPKGHIALQDYGDKVWFRNIKIRELR